MKALISKELKEYFYTPLFYIVTALTLFLTGFLFYHYIDPIHMISSADAHIQLWRPLLGNVNFLLLFIVPILAMNKFSLEFKQKTFYLLKMTELSSLEIVLSKMIATWLAVQAIIFLILLAPGLLLFFLDVPLFEMLVGVAGLSLSSLALTAISLWGSSLTSHPVIACCLSFTMSFVFVVIFLTGQMAHNPLVGELLQYLAIPLHFAPFAAGTVRSFDIVYFVSFAVFLSFLTKRRIERLSL
jgi:ABC-2 type transport system permease protein